MRRTRSLFTAGFLAAVMMVLIFTLANSASAKSDESAAISPLSSGLEPAVPGTFLTGPNEGSPLEIALNFLQANRAALQLSEMELSNLVVKDSYLSQKSGTTHFYFVQSHNGIEVYNTIININVAQDGSVINLGNRSIPDLTSAIQASAVNLTPENAVEKAAEQLGLTFNQAPVIERVIGGAAQAVVISGSGISQDSIPARLIYQPLADGSIRLAWDLIIYELSGDNWWNVRLDAATGEILDKNNFMAHENWNESLVHDESAATESLNSVQLGVTQVPSSYLVYAMPVESPNYAVPAPPADARTVEVEPWLDAPTASPLGWHASQATSWTNTQGNNVDSHKGATRFDCGATLECDPPLDLTQEPTTAGNVNAATVNLFYWNNIIHDVTYEYGFDEPAGNFQISNFGLGGAGNDRVNANAQAIGNCNASFGTPPDGSSPTMNMFVCNIASPSRDGDLDSGVIAHEYGHGISNRLTGGPNNVGCLSNAEQMGEGWSDLMGLILTMEVGDAGTDLRGIGTWLLGQPPNGPGVRTQLYTTNMAINTHTYDDIIGQTSSHYKGEVWASIVWEVVWALTDEHGFNTDFYGDYTTGGNNLALQLILEGMKLQPCSPGFVDGRDAIILADTNFTGGANTCLLWEAFAKRGLGFSAVQGSSNSTLDNSEAFDVPGACQNPPDIGVSTDSMGGTLVQGESMVQSLTISNTGVGNLDWSIAEGTLISEGGCGAPGNLTWIEVNPTNGTTAPGNSDDVDVTFDATGLSVGEHTGELCINSNDPLNSQVPVSLVLMVTPAETFVYLPAVLNADAASAATPLAVLLGGLVLLPAFVVGWRRRR